jgi:rubrerythrin
MTDKLTLDEAIRIAIEYENRVRDMYLEAVESATEDTGKRIFKTLADEEQGHVDYLERRMGEWKSTGHVNDEEVVTILPSLDTVNEGVEKLEKAMDPQDWSVELELLRRARDLESETGSFYRRMVGELDSEGANMFQKFLQIEDAHYDIVQAEIDALTGKGFWFDTMEFRLEAG